MSFLCAYINIEKIYIQVYGENNMFIYVLFCAYTNFSMFIYVHVVFVLFFLHICTFCTQIQTLKILYTNYF